MQPNEKLFPLPGSSWLLVVESFCLHVILIAPFPPPTLSQKISENQLGYSSKLQLCPVSSIEQQKLPSSSEYLGLTLLPLLLARIIVFTQQQTRGLKLIF